MNSSSNTCCLSSMRFCSSSLQTLLMLDKLYSDNVKEVHADQVLAYYHCLLCLPDKHLVPSDLPAKMYKQMLKPHVYMSPMSMASTT